jgi:murein DD-endopeptidase MepM/ murein hydrolase activator NlpD
MSGSVWERGALPGALILGLLVALLSGDASGAPGEARLPGERMLVDEISKMDQQVLEMDKREAELQLQTDALTEKKRQHEAERGNAEIALSERRADAIERLHTLYRMRRRGLATVLLAARSPEDFRRRFQYLSWIIQADRGRIAQYQEGLAGLRRADDQVNIDLAALKESRAELERTRAETGKQREQRVRLLAEIRSSAQLSSSWGRQVEQIRSTYTASPVAAAPIPAEGFRSQRGRLPAPIRAQVIRGFGTYTDATGEARQNLGVDFLTAMNTPFIAVADGTVTRARYERAYGFTVVVEHGSYSTVYTHLSSTRVASGQPVRGGDVLGLAGNSGLIDDQNAYLHFEVRYNNTPQDPAEWLAPGAIQCHTDAVNCP